MVRDGQDPLGLSRDGAVLPTFCNNTVVHQPPAADTGADLEILRETSRRLVESYVREPPLLPRRESSAPPLLGKR